MFLLKRFTESSGPLIFGVFAALFFANFSPELYRTIQNFDLLSVSFFGHKWTTSFFVNDILMAFFFGLAMSEVVRSVLPGGALSSVRKMLGPIFATVGGVLGPIVVFFILAYGMNLRPLFSAANIPSYVASYGEISMHTLLKGWAIPTATDIALAWLFGKMIFGAGSAAVSFLLTLAIVDDFIGLIIIALFYPDPKHPVSLQYLAFVIVGMLIAYAFRRMKIVSSIPYVVFPGILCWYGLISANLHPALALVFVVPFLPTGKKSGKKDVLHNFEHTFKFPVECFVLMLFGFLNAGVSMGSFNQVSMLIFFAAFVGKPVGVLLFGMLSSVFSPLPDKMSWKDLLVVGQISGIALTVAIFVSGEAYYHPTLLGGAKMGSLLTCASGLMAIILARILRVGKF